MREIKFRQPILGLNGNFKGWHYWGFVNGGFISPTRLDLPSHQYTGLKDNTKWEQLSEAEQKAWLAQGKTKAEWNGKEIYEGDVLGGNWREGYIGYCDKCKSFEFIMEDFGCDCCSGDGRWADVVEDDGKLEIIGNIYENPELVSDTHGGQG